MEQCHWCTSFAHLVAIVALWVVMPIELAKCDFFYTSPRNPNITRVDEQSGEVVNTFATLDNGFQDFRGMTLGPDGLLYVSGLEEFSGRFPRWGVFRFDPADGKYIDTFLQAGPINGISFGRDGDLYGVNEFSDSLLQYDGDTGEFLRTVLSGEDFQQGVGTFSLGNQGDVFASTDRSELARYDLVTGERLGPVTDLEQLGFSGYGFDQMALSSDGRLYAAYNYRRRDRVLDGGIMTFDSATGEMLEIVIDDIPAFGAANGGALGLAFAPEGDLFVGSQYAEAILRYDSLSLERLQEIPIAGRANSATFITFLPVPEPTTLLLVISGLAMLPQTRGRRSLRHRRF